MGDESRLEAALAAAERGWRVFPLVAGRKQPRRSAREWEARAICDLGRIERWWRRHPTDNVAIATGPSALVVIDLDVPKPGDPPPPVACRHATGGLDVLTALAQRHGQALEPTFTVATPSGGRHLYYQAPNGVTLRNTSGRAGWKIDSRAAGGYVVAPGSVVDSSRYVVVDDTAPVKLPDWLTRLLAPPPPAATPPVRPRSSRRGYADAALAGEVQRVLDAPAGARNQALNAAAWHLGCHVATGLLPRQMVEDVLYEAGVAAGYRDGPAAVAAVIRAALDARLEREKAS
jgi:hypothetical protein